MCYTLCKRLHTQACVIRCVTRRLIPKQRRAETTIAIKHAAAETEHAKTLVTKHH
jgi:hypothetical protein